MRWIISQGVDLRVSFYPPPLGAGFLRALVADVALDDLFADHAVLQRDKPIPVFGTGNEGEAVTVKLGDDTALTTVKDGVWEVKLPSRAAGGPLEMTVTGNNTVVVRDLLIGDVWLASGQSNMDRRLGPVPMQKEIEGAAEAIAKADYPMIRQFKVNNRMAGKPVSDTRGKWMVCTPSTAEDFTAVGLFFARDVQPTIGVPIGLIQSSWGGSSAEAWTSAAVLKTIPKYADEAKLVEATDYDAQDRDHDAWYLANDPGSKPNADGVPEWASPDLNPADWNAAKLADLWSKGELKDFDGVVWLRTTIDLPPQWQASENNRVRLGAVNGDDTTYVNGVKVGNRDGKLTRTYFVPALALKAGKNVITVRFTDFDAAGEFGKETRNMVFEKVGDASLQPIQLADWTYRKGTALTDAPPLKRKVPIMWKTTSALYNGMIAPLQRVPIKGVIWYQGEANSSTAKIYQTLFPEMIADWRKTWNERFGTGDFPFLYVQIAPHNGMSPEIREAQLLTLQKSPNTGMAVTVDVGDAKDIHPARKQPVGERLALAARAIAYGEKIEYSGPLFESAAFEGGKAIIKFSHVGDGLAARDGELRGFTLAGADGKFVPATATIDGDRVIVTADGIAQPAAVRYGWANVPDVNLFNKNGLPASPFRTDVDSAK